MIEEGGKSCEQCGAMLITAGRRFCGYSCSARSRIRVNTCPVCGIKFTKRAKTCSVPCAEVLRKKSEAAKVKICDLCEQSFSSSSATSRRCQREHFLTCDVCGVEFPWAEHRPRTCSAACAGVLINSDDSWEQRVTTSRDNWGTDSPFQSEVVKAKIRAAHQDKHGADHHYLSPMRSLFTAKAHDTSVARYGDWHSATEEGKRVRMETSIARYGNPNPAQSDEVRARIAASIGNTVNRSAAPRVSSVNRRWADLLRGAGLVVEHEIPLSGFSVDLSARLDESAVVLIDINPTVTHNIHRSFACLRNGCELPCSRHSPPAPDYHLRRAMVASDAGVNLVQVWDWDDDDEIVEWVIALLAGEAEATTDLSRFTPPGISPLGPSLRWSKGVEVIDGDPIDALNNNLLQEGWLPVFTPGYNAHSC